MDSYDHIDNQERDSYLDHDDDSSDDDEVKECDDDEVDEKNVVVLSDEEEERSTGGKKSSDYYKRFRIELLYEMHVEEEIGIEAAIANIYVCGGSPPMNIDKFLLEGMNAYTAALMTVLLGIPMIVSIKDKQFIDLSMYIPCSVISCVKYKYLFCLKAGSNYNTKILSKYFPILFSNIMGTEKSQGYYDEEVEELVQVRKKFGWKTPNVGSKLIYYSLKSPGQRGCPGEPVEDQATAIKSD